MVWRRGNVEVCLRLPILSSRLHEQVCDLLHVDFEEGHCDAELSLVRVILDVVKQVIYATRHYSTLHMNLFCSSLTVHMIHRGSRTKYSVSLSTSSLSICHDHPIESIKNVFNYWLSDLLISIFLFRPSVQDAVKIEVSHVVVGSRQCYRFIILKVPQYEIFLTL